MNQAEFQSRGYRKPKIPSSFINVPLYPYRPTPFRNSLTFSAICWFVLALKNKKTPTNHYKFLCTLMRFWRHYFYHEQSTDAHYKYLFITMKCRKTETTFATVKPQSCKRKSVSLTETKACESSTVTPPTSVVSLPCWPVLELRGWPCVTNAGWFPEQVLHLAYLFGKFKKVTNYFWDVTYAISSYTVVLSKGPFPPSPIAHFESRRRRQEQLRQRQ